VADRETLVIGISASGKTEAVMAALANARARGAITLGLSNTPTSSLATEFAASLTVHATRKGWPTQSSTAAIALLCGLAATLAEALGTADAMAIRQLRADLADLPMLVDAVTSAFDAPAQALAETFAAAAIILFAGAGAHQAAAFFGAAKIKELSPIHAVSMPLEEYHHYRTQKAGDLLFLVAPDGASHARALDTALVGRARGGRTVALLPKGETEIAGVVETPLFLPAVRPELASIIYSVPLHLFAYHFAKARFARKLGYPGAFPATAA
jgi:glucosamine--fructose-6-phosphate aminotransferase (isomerizing)